MYCALRVVVPAEWGKKNLQMMESNPFCIFKTKTYSQIHATCSISIDTKSNKN